MFENFRDKIQTVQQDLSLSLKGLTLVEKIPINQKGNIRKNKKVKVDLNAGADILNHYQKHWETLHKQSEDNSKLSEEMALTVDRIHDCVLRKNVVVNEYISLLSTVSSVEESVTSVCNDLKLLEKNIILVEQLLSELESAKENENIQKVALNQRYEVALYKEKKSAQFEQFRVKYAIMHTEKVKHFEKMQRAKSKERQLAFQSAFEKELNNYKIYGTIEKKPAVSGTEKRLDEIQIETDEADLQALDEFLSE